MCGPISELLNHKRSGHHPWPGSPSFSHDVLSPDWLCGYTCACRLRQNDALEPHPPIQLLESSKVFRQRTHLSRRASHCARWDFPGSCSERRRPVQSGDNRHEAQSEMDSLWWRRSVSNTYESEGSCYFRSMVGLNGPDTWLSSHRRETRASPAFTLGMENPMLETSRVWVQPTPACAGATQGSLGPCLCSHGELAVPRLLAGLLHFGLDNKLFEVTLSQSIFSSCPLQGKSQVLLRSSGASDSRRAHFFPGAGSVLKCST